MKKLLGCIWKLVKFLGRWAVRIIVIAVIARMIIGDKLDMSDVLPLYAIACGTIILASVWGILKLVGLAYARVTKEAHEY